MIRRIAPQFFTIDLTTTLAYYQDVLGFACRGPWDANGPPRPVRLRFGKRIVCGRLGPPALPTRPGPQPPGTPT